MNDTQWPRFQVFLQEKPGAPLVDVGSVHAPDGELALLNARDIFSRRPECYSLWVVPADAILSATAAELAVLGEPTDAAAVAAYSVFAKLKPAGAMTYVAEVSASTPLLAIRQVMLGKAGSAQPGLWWAFPTRLALRSQPDEVDSLFAPARDKSFRLSTEFHTHTAMRTLRSQPASHLHQSDDEIDHAK